MFNSWKPRKPSIKQRCSDAVTSKLTKWERNSAKKLRTAIQQGTDPRIAWVECSKSFWYQYFLISVAGTETANAYKWSDKHTLDLEIADFCKFVQLGMKLAQPDFEAEIFGVDIEPGFKFLRPGLILAIPDFYRAYRRNNAKKRTDFLAAADVAIAYRALLPESRDWRDIIQQALLVDVHRNSQRFGYPIFMPNNEDYQKIQAAESLIANDEFLYDTYRRRWIIEHAPDDWPASWTLQEFQLARQKWVADPNEGGVRFPWN